MICHSEHDLSYATVLNERGARSLLLDMHYPDPQDDLLRPGLLMIHGGSWMEHDRDHVDQAVQRALVAGLVVCNIQYRLSTEAPFPAQLDDCRAALRWFCRHARRYGADPERITVWGESAGGHLASLLALTAHPDEGPACYPWRVIALNPVVTLLGDPDSAAPEAVDVVLTLMGGKYPHEAPELYQAASPIEHVTAHAPPFLLIHGSDDTVVPFEQSAMLAERLKQAGVRADLLRIDKGGHGQLFDGADPRVVALAYQAMWQFALGE